MSWLGELTRGWGLAKAEWMQSANGTGQESDNDPDLQVRQVKVVVPRSGVRQIPVRDQSTPVKPASE